MEVIPVSKSKAYVKDYNKQYYQKTKSLRVNVPVHCSVCDCYVSKSKLSCHQKTNKHLLHSKINEKN